MTTDAERQANAVERIIERGERDDAFAKLRATDDAAEDLEVVRVSERERLARMLYLTPPGPMTDHQWSILSSRVNYSMGAQFALDCAYERADIVIAAGFRYTPPENYHSCNPFCEQH